jgi:hypothetical protein
MSRFLKKKKDVEYKEFGKNQAYHLRMDIDGERVDVISFFLPTDKKIDTKVKGGVSPEGAGVEGERSRESKGEWEAIIITPDYGCLPYDTWKKIREKVANTISTATGSSVNSSDVEISGSFVVSRTLSCPRCGTPILINFGKCPKCGETLE